MSYSDIKNIKRWNPVSRERMPVSDRASQFHPFDFSGQTKIDKEVAANLLSLTGGYDTGEKFYDDITDE